MESKLIVMLTNHDQTVRDALEVFESAKHLPVEHWGFKDVGLPREEMARLLDALRRAGKTTVLEVVSYGEQACMEAARLAVDLGFDMLMGTVYHDSVFAYLRDKPIRFMPFCGRVHSSPSVLEGGPDEIVEDARALLEKGVFGIDLLAFRHQNGAELARHFCRSIKAPVVLAGSIASYERIDFVNEVNPWGYTMGGALFEEAFEKGAGFAGNLEKVVSYMNRISHRQPHPELL